MKPSILSASRLSFPLATALAALLAATSASATNLHWDTNGTGTAGSGAATGTWGTDAFWTTDSTGANVGSPVLTAATTIADDLFFAAGTNGGNGTVTVLAGSTQYAHSITFEEGSITLAPGAGAAINLGSVTAGSGLFFANVSGGFAINTPIILNSAATNISLTNRGNQAATYGATGTIAGSSSGLQTITIGGTGSGLGSSTFNGIISNGGGGGTVALTVNALSNNILAAANTYTGATNILLGNLRIDNAATFTNTSAINLAALGRLEVNVANQSLAKLATGVVERSFLRYSQAQGTGGTGPGTIFGTVELNHASVNPNYVLDFAIGSTLTNTITTNYTSALTLSGNASIDSSTAAATYSTGGITASTAGAKTLTLVGTNTAANTISGAIGNGSGTIDILKSGVGNWILSGTNTYTGKTQIDAGTLQLAKQLSLYNNTPASWTAANLNVKSGATLALNVDSAGTAGFDSTNLDTLLTNISVANTAAEGLQSGANLGIETATATGATFTQGNVIANSTGSGSFHGAIGLTKLGAGTLVLDKANTFTGRTLISGGTLQLGAGGTSGSLSATSTIINNGILAINRSNPVSQGTDFSATPITGTGSLTIAGGSSTTLNAANTFSGTTTVSGAGTTLILANDLALQNSALVTTGGGTVTFPDVTPVLGGLSGSTDLSAAIPAFNTTTALSLNATSGSFTYGGVIGDGAGSMTLTKNGASTQILSGANSYTGATIVNAGTLTVGSGANGSLNSSSTLQMGGGTFNYSRTGAGQTVNGLTINAGNSTVNNTSAGQTLTLGAITRTASVYGTVNFATLTGSISTTTGNTNSIVGPWATTGSTTTLRYAIGSPDGSTATNISALTGTTATAGTLGNVTDATGNFEYSAVAATATDLTANTLRYSGGATTTAIGATNTLTLNGLMNAGTAALTISGGPLTGGIIIGSNNELVVAANAQNTTISAAIKDGASAGTLVYSGGSTGSTLSLSGTNLHTGGSIVNSGTLSVGSLTALPVSANVTVRNGATFNYGITGTHRAYNVALNGGTLAQTVEGITLPGTFTLGTGTTSTLSIAGRNNDITGGFTGAGNLIITGNNTAILTGTNNYTGTTTLSGTGNTIFGKPSALYNGNSADWTSANITVNSGAVIGFRGGDGTTGFTSAQINTILGNLSTVNNNGLLAGSSVMFDTRASAFNHSGVITDSTGPGGGSVGVVYFGAAGGGLTLSGANTFTGRVSFRALFAGQDAALRVSSFNSVFTNPTLGTVHSTSSNLGAPTTVANGTIVLGNNSAQVNTTLTYTGTGETTDRVIAIEGNGSSPTNIYQSGSGLLKFTSPFTANSGDTPINLRGVGNGEVAGIGANGSLAKLDSGTWTIAGRSGVRGLTTVSGGALVLGHALALNGGIGSTGGVGGLTFSGGVLGLGTDNNTFSRPLAAAGTAGAVTFTGAGGWAAYGADRTVNLGGASASVTWATASTGLNGQTLILGNATSTHTLDFQNPLVLDANNRTVQVDNGSAAIDGKLSGALSGGDGAKFLLKTGLGTLALTGTNSIVSQTRVDAGTLLVNGSNTGSGAVSVSIGTLGGSGSIAGAVTIGNGTPLAVTDSTLAPGNSIGTIATGNLAFNSDGRYACELNGTSETSDQANVTGTVSINAATTLTVSVAGSLSGGQEYIIVANDGGDAVTGTFATLPQDAIVGNYGGTDLKISYTGGDGNDIVLFTDGAPSTPYDDWATLKGLTGLNNAKNLDPDNDGKNNLAEFAFDGNPLSGANDGKIVGKVATVGGNQVMTLTLPVRAVASFSPSSGDLLSSLIDGIYYRIEGDVSLSTFADTITEVTGGDATTIQTGLPALTATGAPGWTYRTFRHSGTVPTTPKAFLRAKASETP